MSFIVPDELRFAITRKCDGGCRHCYNLSGKDTDRLSADDFIGLIKVVNTVNPGFDRITLTGGEPMNEKVKLLTISRFAKSLGIRVRLVTRGWELTPEICTELKEAGVTRVQIGLDSSGEYVYGDDTEIRWDTFHSWLRSDESGFKKSVNAIRMAVEGGMDVSVRYSLCLSNLKDVVKTYQLISALGASKFKFRVLFPDGRAKARLRQEIISGKDMANAQHSLIKASKGNKTIVEITQPCMYSIPGHPVSTASSGYSAFKEACSCGKTAAYIDSNGDVKYCLFDESVIGNVCDNPFLEIWNSDLAEKVREQRCPMDQSGNKCSSFKVLYSEFGDFRTFMNDYVKGVHEIND